MKTNEMRADVALFKRGMAPSRERAQALIGSGLVTLNGKPLSKPAVKVGDEDTLVVCGSDLPYVSRGGFKLEKALNVFGGNVKDVVAMDIGASTGGFTDVLLQNGASLVYAIDVGTGQLDPRIASDTRVISMEHTNARALEPDMFPTPPTLGVMDVSFISIKLILPAAFRVLGEKGRMICLIKPQFEAGRENIGKGGIVTKQSVHIDVLSTLVCYVPTLDWKIRAIDFSPISGGDGNIEFIADMTHICAAGNSVTREDILKTVKAAHISLRK